MDTFRITQLRELLGVETTPCVSVYLPTHPAGEQGQQDPVRLKNLLQRAEDQLVEQGMRSVMARDLLQEARDLPHDPTFWRARSQGLALFRAPNFWRAYRLPRPFPEVALVNRHFHVKPLLPLLASDGQYYLLTLSQNRVRLMTGSRYGIEEVVVPDLPENLELALNYTDTERGEQVHSAMRGSLGKQAAVFHGQGGHNETHKDDLVQYFRLVDASLDSVLHDEHAPLLLAGVDYLLPIYRNVSRYRHISPVDLMGNFDYATDSQLHQRAWEILEPQFVRTRSQAERRFIGGLGTPRSIDDLGAIVSASFAGRVDTLFVDLHAFRWGLFDPSTHACTLHAQAQPGDDDLLNVAAIQTMLQGGTVYCVEPSEVPSGKEAAAWLRY